MKHFIPCFVAASAALFLFTTTKAETWSFVSATSSLTETNYYGSSGVANAGSWVDDPSWYQVTLQCTAGVSDGASDLEEAGVRGHVYYTFKASSNPFNLAETGVFYKYRRHDLENWINGYTPPVSGYATYTYSSITDNWTGYWETWSLPAGGLTLDGQQTYNQNAINYLNYPDSETYPYLDSYTVSGSVFYSATDSAYEVTFDINLSGSDSVDAMGVETNDAAGETSSTAGGLAQAALTLEPHSVAATTFTTGNPLGGG